MTHQRFSHKVLQEILFTAMLVTFYLLNNTFSLSVIDLSLSVFTVKSNSSGMLFSATAREGRK